MYSRIPAFRLNKEMAHFDELVYNTEFKLIRHINDNSVIVEMIDGTIYTINRSLNFFEPPCITTSDTSKQDWINKCGIEWSPAYTCVKWILILHSLI